MPDDSTSCRKFWKALDNATSYVNSLKNKTQPDHESYKNLVNTIVEKAADGIREVDTVLATGGVDAIAEALRMIGSVHAFFEFLPLEKKDFGPQTQAFTLWGTYKGACGHRKCILQRIRAAMDKAESLSTRTMADNDNEKEAETVKLISMVSEVREDLTTGCADVPLEHASLAAINEALDRTNIKHIAQEQFKMHFESFKMKCFGGDTFVVADAEEIFTMLRWCQWSSLPKLHRECIELSRHIAYLVVNKDLALKEVSGSIVAVTPSLSQAYISASCIAEVSLERLLQQFQALRDGNIEGVVKEVKTTASQIIAGVNGLLQQLVGDLRVEVEKLEKASSCSSSGSSEEELLPSDRDFTKQFDLAKARAGMDSVSKHLGKLTKAYSDLAKDGADLSGPRLVFWCVCIWHCCAMRLRCLSFVACVCVSAFRVPPRTDVAF
eukprot:3427807-Lingulodinium_polyedra.AAC.2